MTNFISVSASVLFSTNKCFTACAGIQVFIILYSKSNMQSSTHTDITYQPISDAYDGKCVFVTGSSGFLGKVFVEKILYACPKIGKVYILLRETAKMSAAEKLKNMLDCPVFKRLREERPRDLEKLIPITGDICEPKLGINAGDEQVLMENVSMVFHFAATVKFNDPLHVALNVNVEGTRRVMELCAKIRNLQVFVYVSTAFSNGNRKVINEVVYPPVWPLSEVEEHMEQTIHSQEYIKRLLHGMPNTYTMSKNLAENVVAEFREKHSFPMIIVRPSIVLSCKDEPVEGWLDNWFGPTALVVAIGKGALRAMGCDGNNVIDFIPADYVSNLVIVAAARSRGTDEIEVYNSCSSAVNPITLRQFTDIIIDYENNKKTNFFPIPKLLYIKVGWLMSIVTFLLETIPAYIADCVSRMFGKKNIHLKMLTRINGVRQALVPFTSRTWLMRSSNVSALANSLSLRDRHLFHCDAASINWKEYVPVYLRGVRKYLLENKQ